MAQVLSGSAQIAKNADTTVRKRQPNNFFDSDSLSRRTALTNLTHQASSKLIIPAAQTVILQASVPSNSLGQPNPLCNQVDAASVGGNSGQPQES